MTRLPEMADFTQDTEGISRRLTQLREMPVACRGTGWPSTWT